MNTLYLQNSYIAKYDFIINKNIIEYDISKANISILYSYGYITKNQYEYYYNLPKQKREIVLGLLQRDNNKIKEGLKNGFIDCRKIFIEQNNIPQEAILYIDKDSMTIIEYPIKNTNINDIVKFIPKNKYTSFYNLNGIHLLYFNSGDNESFRLKYANEEEMVKKHNNGFLDIILTIAYSGQNESTISTLKLIRNIYNLYINKKLDMNSYREFNYNSKFRFLSNKNMSYIYFSDIIEHSNMKYLDISYNLNIIQLFYKIFNTKYFNSL